MLYHSHGGLSLWLVRGDGDKIRFWTSCMREMFWRFYTRRHCTYSSMWLSVWRSCSNDCRWKQQNCKSQQRGNQDSILLTSITHWSNAGVGGCGVISKKEVDSQQLSTIVIVEYNARDDLELSSSLDCWVPCSSSQPQFCWSGKTPMTLPGFLFWNWPEASRMTNCGTTAAL